MKAKKSVYVGIGIVVIMFVVYYLSIKVPDSTKNNSLDLDFTYEEVNTNLKQSLQTQGILMSSPLEFKEPITITKYCSFFTDKEKQKLIEYCTSTELTDGAKNFIGNIHLVGSPSAPKLVMIVLQSNAAVDNLEQIKTIFGLVAKELVCDCWDKVKPGGYDTIESWIDALKDFHMKGDKPHSKSKPISLESKHLQIELTTTKDGYVWELLVAR